MTGDRFRLVLPALALLVLAPSGVADAWVTERAGRIPAAINPCSG
ncbi:hypothetical protein [Pseudonocardia kujensis]|nr:hypothetical protein [Pseudonocardia kujensis]